MSKRDKQQPSELAAAAEALDDQLRRFESLAEQLRRAPLDSEKNLERASKMLRDVAQLDQQLNERVAALVAAVSAARERQQAQAESVHVRAQELQQRAETFKALLERYGALGHGAAELNQRMQEFARQRSEARSPEQGASLISSLESLQEQMGRVADEAQAVASLAEEQDFTDVARQAESLRQQILSARNKMALLRKGLSPG